MLRNVQLLLLVFVGVKGTIIGVPKNGANVDLLEEDNQMFWFSNAQSALNEKLAHPIYEITPEKAKSGVMIIGTGMSIVTIRLARQMITNELKHETPLSFEQLPVTGFVKHYCIDSQVGDDFCTANAYLTGSKTFRRHSEENYEDEQISSIAEWAIAAKKSVGIVTTSKLTDPKVAALYGRISNNSNSTDLATQMIKNYPGNRINVILGGGLEDFAKSDENLIKYWEEIKIGKGRQFVETKQELLNISPKTDYLLGIFNESGLNYHKVADSNQPSLEVMTEAALKILTKNKNGFFLFVLNDKIGTAHQENRVMLAIDETLRLSNTVAMIKKKVDMENTMVVVSSDKGNTITMSGYPSRWADFREVFIDEVEHHELPVLVMSYATGPAYYSTVEQYLNYIQSKQFAQKDPLITYPSTIPLAEGAFGGEDVPMFVSGPNQHLFSGVREQHELPHLIAYSMCMGPGHTSCEKYIQSSTSGASLVLPSIIGVSILVTTISIIFRYK